MIDIIIPTCKDNVDELIKEIHKNTRDNLNCIIATCKLVSAATNRNIGLEMSSADLVIMIDDDMTGFYPGWLEDMIQYWTENMVIMSARLLAPNYELGYMLTEDNRMVKGTVTSKKREVPTACVMFRNDGLRYDENFIGSGFEDNDFCRQLQTKYPDGKFVVNNECRLIHKNEQKNQRGHYWTHNKAYYEKKWNLV